ncbi:hypothetical protein F0267_26030 [Vibrio coralliilyticus]|uniref:baseplate J/gp47 family protein n=1 Tax=Vibrio TaxID=662 RepID=UPI00148C78D3|nr:MULTISPECIES: baseplate J/gp47 family protein [Vibrio]NOH26174.1 hypothetical protein [Vibrio europaeus]NOH41689.1 hypothetical protein [Vibrio coralliilyticus]
MTTPSVLVVEPFETMRERFINESFYPYAKAQVGYEMAMQLTRALRSPNEAAAILLDVFIIFRQAEVRRDNYKALQQFSKTATESDAIDLIVGKYGLKRQVIEPADPTAFPPKEAVMESNESLLLRYSLAPFGLSTTGTRTGYEFHALTLGERPLISVETVSETEVIQRFKFQSTDGVRRPKSAIARMVEKNSGKVEVRILSFEGDGVADAPLVAAVSDYLNRPDIAQESDDITVKSADVIRYEIEIEVTEISEPNKLVDKTAFDKALLAYAKEQHKLNGEAKRSRLIQISHNHNAYDVNIIKPAADVDCQWFEAPYCTGVKSSVRPHSFENPA